jgi:nucleoside-diphosphate-sugar epimerase
MWYPIAKTTAEEQAWDFAKKNGINLVTLCPTFIIGYVLPPEISSTSNDVLQLFKGNRGKFFIFGRMGYIHLDDAVTAHILCYERPEAEGRYIVDSGVMETKDMAEAVAKYFPQYSIPTDYEGQKSMPYYNFDTSKLKKLGLEKYKSLEEMFQDAYTSFKDKGLL